MEIGKPVIAVFDSKSYDRDYFSRASAADKLDLRFHEFRLTPETASAADGAQAACVASNDVVNREVLERLAGSGARLVALRCAGFNNVDLDAARELRVTIARVPSYSPHGRGRAYYRSHSCDEPQNPSRVQPGQGIELFAQRFGGL